MSPIRTTQFLRAWVLMAALSPGIVAAQSAPQPPPAPQSKPSPAPDARPLVQLRVQVTISRYAGEKKTTSLPFTLWVTTDGGSTQLNAGQYVEIPTATAKSTAAGVTTAPAFVSRNVGTQISCSATPTSDSRFKITLSVGDSYLAPAKSESGLPTLKSLHTQNALLLRDGQAAEFASSTDMITGEVTRIDVTATVLK